MLLLSCSFDLGLASTCGSIDLQLERVVPITTELDK